MGSDGNLYGTAEGGGVGAVFETTTSGHFKTLHNFCSPSGCLDGAQPYAGLVQSTNGKFYGATFSGGANYVFEDCSYECGTVFSVFNGLSPFVEALPASGATGASIVVLGNKLTGSSSVTFNGTPSAFTVLSSTEIKATVPAGASSGSITVTTATGTLTSNVSFRVTP